MANIRQAKRRYCREVERQEALVTEIMRNVTEMRDEGIVTKDQAARIGQAVSFYFHRTKRLLRDVYGIGQ